MAVGAVVWQLDETNATEHRVLTPTTPAPAAVSSSSSGTRSAGGNGSAATGSRGSQPAAAAAAAATVRLPDISHLAVSPDSQFLAVFTSDGRMLVLNSGMRGVGGQSYSIACLGWIKGVQPALGMLQSRPTLDLCWNVMFELCRPNKAHESTGRCSDTCLLA